MIRTTRTNGSAASLIVALLASAATLTRCEGLRGGLLSAPYVRAQAGLCGSRVMGAVSEGGAVPRWLLAIVVATLTLLTGLPSGALAECKPAPGTVINRANWHQYKDCSSDGVQSFWSQKRLLEDARRRGDPCRHTSSMGSAQAVHGSDREIRRQSAVSKAG
jgi:hypothetical protein